MVMVFVPCLTITQFLDPPWWGWFLSGVISNEIYEGLEKLLLGGNN